MFSCTLIKFLTYYFFHAARYNTDVLSVKIKKKVKKRETKERDNGLLAYDV